MHIFSIPCALPICFSSWSACPSVIMWQISVFTGYLTHTNDCCSHTSSLLPSPFLLMETKIPVFWDGTLCQWVEVPDVSRITLSFPSRSWSSQMLRSAHPAAQHHVPDVFNVAQHHECQVLYCCLLLEGWQVTLKLVTPCAKPHAVTCQTPRSPWRQHIAKKYQSLSTELHKAQSL